MRTSALTALILKSIILPLTGAYFLSRYEWSVLPKGLSITWVTAIVYAVFALWTLFQLKWIEESKNSGESANLIDLYHSKPIRIAMSVYLSFLTRLCSFLAILKKPFAFSLFGFPVLFMLKPELLAQLADRINFLACYVLLSFLCVFFLSPREEELFGSAERAKANITAKIAGFKEWVYKIDTGVEKAEIPFFPKDKVPSVSFYVFHFLMVLLRRLARFIELILNKYHLKRFTIIFLPLVALGEFFYFLFRVSILAGFLIISFAARLLLRTTYVVSFALAFAFNVYNLVDSYKSKSGEQVVWGLGITLGCFFALESVRHLNRELPLFFDGDVPPKRAATDHLQKYRNNQRWYG